MLGTMNHPKSKTRKSEPCCRGILVVAGSSRSRYERAHLNDGREREGKRVNVYQYMKLLLEKQSNYEMSDEELERFALWNPEEKTLLDSRVTG